MIYNSTQQSPWSWWVGKHIPAFKDFDIIETPMRTSNMLCLSLLLLIVESDTIKMQYVEWSMYYVDLKRTNLIHVFILQWFNEQSFKTCNMSHYTLIPEGAHYTLISNVGVISNESVCWEVIENKECGR